ncbi:heat shock protein HtpX [Halostagnicola larsenii XH-48]|uniref:Protease HtpX homolog n=1 Tax=Halostagnicola larsenii XH-48 TaxID=797299 RepID=W0JTV4_9EURY|nr:M48 family metalloprotease [Halostagnicola larsenii]AHG00448.1 heat shock protein HtpX [Halostagnicola larsenii XH-48]
MSSRLAASVALESDRELRLRTALALFFIVVLPFAFVYTFVFLLNTVGIALLEWANERPYTGEFYVDPLLLVVVILGGLVIQYLYGPSAVLGSVGANRVDAESYPTVHAMVTRLAAQADVPKPDVAVIDSEVPNAFAVAGGNTEAVVVTTGLLELLSEDELEATLAHELAHLANHDARVMTTAWLLPTITYYLAIIAFTILYWFVRILGSGGGSSGGDRDGRALLVAIVVIVVTTVLTLAVSAMFWFASVLLYRLLSRYREHAADRAAATITGSPAALASALEKIDGAMPEVPDEDLRALDGGVEALYLAPLESRAFSSAELISTDIFPDTHPPTAERLEHLRDLEREGVGA